MPFYCRNFLTNVIARVDYQPILVLTREMPIDFQERIRQEFPRFQRSFPFKLTIPPEGEAQSVQKPVFWQFKDKMESNTVTVSADFISCETKNYTKFNEFVQKLSSTYNTFCELYKPALIKRIGLRYVNQIEIKDGNPFDWDGFISSALTSQVRAFPTMQQDITRQMSQMQFSIDDMNLLFQFGFYNSEHPNRITKKEFILDYDCFTDQETEPDKVLLRFGMLHIHISNLFEESIQDGFRNLMGVANEISTT
ncbi:MAG: TIGR04255 family protein [Syntrophobacter sp.]